MARALGSTQQAVLRCLRQHKCWYLGCGWIWSNNSETVRLMESLVKRGLVTKSKTTGLMGAQVDLYMPVGVDEELG